ncbi:hypothetical protein Cni_G25608 [Canna indica]|uniref:Uncharacterized protein n=1 Tax=Canna indica TaxID=4628 RepID=A0AAQ3KY86_9LILI|nr:hypothetical protein Cni_G25608 [Canna indica]
MWSQYSTIRRAWRTWCRWTRRATTNATPPTPPPTTAKAEAQPHRRYYFICSREYCYGPPNGNSDTVALVVVIVPISIAQALELAKPHQEHSLVQIKRALLDSRRRPFPAASLSSSSSLESLKSNIGISMAAASPCRYSEPRQSEQVELESIHVSMQPRWKAWPQADGSRSSSSSSNSQRQTTHSNGSLEPTRS